MRLRIQLSFVALISYFIFFFPSIPTYAVCCGPGCSCVGTTCPDPFWFCNFSGALCGPDESSCCTQQGDNICCAKQGTYCCRKANVSPYCSVEEDCNDALTCCTHDQRGCEPPAPGCSSGQVKCGNSCIPASADCCNQSGQYCSPGVCTQCSNGLKCTANGQCGGGPPPTSTTMPNQSTPTPNRISTPTPNNNQSGGDSGGGGGGGCTLDPEASELSAAWLIAVPFVWYLLRRRASRPSSAAILSAPSAAAPDRLCR